MSTSMPQRGLQLRSLIHANGELELALHTVEAAPPEPTEVLVRVEAAPINPSDLGLLFGPADIETLATSGSGASARATAACPSACCARWPAASTSRCRSATRARASWSRPAPSRGPGAARQDGGAARRRHVRAVPHREGRPTCLALPAGATAAEGASCFVNPLTALGMVETMRREGHTALVHTAAASNLGPDAEQHLPRRTACRW